MNINEPWEAQINWAPDFPKDSYVFDGHGNEIAGPIDGEEANLIAAAPELLEALKELLDEARTNMRGGKGHLIDKARSAIAKAEGRS